MISVIIPNYNGAAFLEPCLQSVRSQSLPDEKCEIIVVDNGSTDDSAAIIAKHSDSIRLISNRENIGFTGAINQGAAAAQGDLLLLLNNDAVLAAGSLAQLLALIHSAPADVVGIQPLLLNAQEPSRIDSAGIAIGKRFRARDQLHGQPVEQTPDSPCEIWGGCAACLLVRRTAFNEADGFDFYYFFELDDVDFALRIRWLGYRFMLAPQSIVYHHRSPTTKRIPGERYRRHIRNHLMTIAKDLPSGMRWRLILYRFQRDLLSIPHYIRTGSLRIVFGAWCDFISQGRKIREKRKRIIQSARISPREMIRQLGHFMMQPE